MPERNGDIWELNYIRLMRFILISVFLVFVSSSQAQTCDLLTLDGVWLDPFNNQQINVLCTNESWDEIYSYPSWLMRDMEGNVIAEEQVEYFGIAGPSFHRLVTTEPWPDNTDSMPVTMELWTGFSEALACSFVWEFVPRELQWTGTGDQGCFPVRVVAYSNEINGCSLSLSLENGVGENVWSEVLEIDESTQFVAQSDSLCLSQFECYDLQAISSPTSYINMQLVDPADGMALNLNHWSYYSIFDEVMPLDTTFTLDLYGGNCSQDQSISASEVARDLMYPNPVNKGGRFRVPFVMGDEVTLWDGTGHRMDLDESVELMAPSVAGVYYIVVKSIHNTEVYTLIVK